MLKLACITYDHARVKHDYAHVTRDYARITRDHARITRYYARTLLQIMLEVYAGIIMQKPI